MEAIVDHVAAYLATALDHECFKPLGMATGRTMEPFYAALIQRLATWPLPQFEQLKRCWLSFNLDEYVGLSPGDSRSFAAYMHAQLGCYLDLSPCQLQLPDGMAKDPAKEARRYGSALHQSGGIGLQLLGLGAVSYTHLTLPTKA